MPYFYWFIETKLIFFNTESYEALGTLFWNQKMPLKNPKMHFNDSKLPLDQKRPSIYQNPSYVDQNFYSFGEKLATNCSDLDERVLILHYESQPILGISTKTYFRGNISFFRNFYCKNNSI